MSYTRVNWQNSPDTTTPLSADNLNVMDAGIKQNADDIETLQNHAYDSELNSTSTNAPQTKTVQSAVDTLNTAIDGVGASLGEVASDLDDTQADVDDAANRIAILEEAVYAEFPTATASGNPISITDGADGIPVDNCTVSFSPVQDLNGQDAPYPAGGGVNLFDESTVTIGKWWTNSGNLSDNAPYACISADIPVTGGETYGIKCFGEIPYSMSIVEFDSNGFLTRNHASSLATKVVTFSANTSKVVVQFAAGAGASTPMTAEILASYQAIFYKGSTAPDAYSPYSNICPITGFDSLTVYRTGKNLISPRIYEGISYNASVGTVFTPAATDDAWTQGSGKLTYTTTSSYTVLSLMTGLLPAGTYAYSISKLTGDTLRFTRYLLDSEYTVLSKSYSASMTTSTGTYTLTEPGYIAFHFDNGTSSGAREITAQVEVGDTATDYEAYTGTSITARLGDTYYGGTVDMVSGEATITYVGVDMGSLTWERGNNSTDYYYFFTEPSNKAANYNFISSCYENLRVVRTQLTDNGMGVFNTNSATSYRRVVIRDDDYTTAADFKASVTGQTLVYQLTTSLTLTLTAQQLATLKGDNTLWTDGDSISLTYHTPKDVITVDEEMSSTSTNPVQNRAIQTVLEQLRQAITDVCPTVTVTGNPVSITPASVSPNVTVLSEAGSTTQDGTPTPSNPVEITPLAGYDVYDSANNTYSRSSSYDATADQYYAIQIEDGDGNVTWVGTTAAIAPLYADDSIDFVSGVVTRGNGVIADMSTLSWSKDGSFTNYYATINDMLKFSEHCALEGYTYCTAYPAYWNSSLASIRASSEDDVIYQRNMYAQIWIIDSSYDSANDFKTGVTGQRLVYTLAEPTTETVTLSADISTLSSATLTGTGTLTIAYKQDIKTYIDNAISAALS